MFFRSHVSTQAKNLSDNIHSAFSSFTKLLHNAQKVISFAAKNPPVAIVSLLYLQVQLMEAVTISRNITCPDANSLATQLNEDLLWPNCQTDYPVIGSGALSYTISRDPDEVFFGYINVNRNCSTIPDIQLGNAQLETRNNFKPFFNETRYFFGKSLTMIGCRYPIISSSLSVNSTTCGPFFDPSECFLFPQNNHYLEVSSILDNSTCYVNNSTFSCITDKSASPLNGVWQQGQHQYPILSYNNMQNTLFVAHEVNIPKQNASCVISHFANATDYPVTQIPVYNNGSFHYEDLNNTFQFYYRDNVENITLITRTSACLNYFKADEDYLSLWSNSITLLDNDTLSIQSWTQYNPTHYNGTYQRISAGSSYYLDNLNNSYDFSSDFNVTQAKAAAESVNRTCDLHLTTASSHAPQAFFKFNATDNSQIFPQQIEIDFYTNVSSKILNCIENALLMFTGNNPLLSSSSSTGAAISSSVLSSSTSASLSSSLLFRSSTAASSSFSSSMGASSTAATSTSTATTSTSSSENQSTSSNNSANSTSESQSSLWTSPIPYLIAAGTVVASLIGYVTYKRCRANKISNEENIELLDVTQNTHRNFQSMV